MKLNRKRSWILVIIIAGVFFAGMISERVIFDNQITNRDRNSIVLEAQAKEEHIEDLADVIEQVVPAVVNISAKRVQKQRWIHPFYNDPFFRRFFDIPERELKREIKNLGSGVIVSKDGYILTNNHLVEGAEEVQVALLDEREYEAEIVGTDSRSDVAVLKIDQDDLPVMELGNSENLRLGQTVLAIGYPFGVGQTVTKGIVSALGRELRLGQLRDVTESNFIQTDAAINPGNSGGALIDVHGKMVGINTAILSRTGENLGIGFAIPIKLARRIMDSIIEHGRVIRGYLGVMPQTVSREIAESFGLDEPEGVIITEVIEGTAADKAGLKRDDIILTYDGEKVESDSHLRRIVSATNPGEEVEIEIWREGKRKKLDVEIDERPDAEENLAEMKDEFSTLFVGVSMETLNDYYRQQLELPSNMKGIIITEIDEGSVAYESGLRKGDVILEINREVVSGVNDLKNILDKSDKRALLRVYRRGVHMYIVIK
jgi:serine protease Do